MNGTPLKSASTTLVQTLNLLSTHEGITTHNNSKIYDVSPPILLSVELKQCSRAAGVTGAGGSGAR